MRSRTGWERGDWVMLDLSREGFDKPVSRRDGDRRAAVSGDRRGARALSARSQVARRAAARRFSKDDRARLGEYVGRITRIDLARVQIDVGGQDKAIVGDVYQVLSPRVHQPIGRLKITEVDALHAWAVRLDQRELTKRAREERSAGSSSAAVSWCGSICSKATSARRASSSKRCAHGPQIQELTDQLAEPPPAHVPWQLGEDRVGEVLGDPAQFLAGSSAASSSTLSSISRQSASRSSVRPSQPGTSTTPSAASRAWT